MFIKLSFEDRKNYEFEEIDEDLKEIIINDFKPYWELTGLKEPKKH